MTGAALAALALALLLSGCVSLDAAALARELRQDKASVRLKITTRFQIGSVEVERYWCEPPP